MSEETARAYYEAVDAHHYDRFADLLAPGVVHERPDRTIEGREALVGFMRDDRPDEDTSHEVEAVYGGDAGEVAVRGRLLAADGSVLFSFVDVFDFAAAMDADGSDDGPGGEPPRIARIRTYTR